MKNVLSVQGGGGGGGVGGVEERDMTDVDE